MRLPFDIEIVAPDPADEARTVTVIVSDVDSMARLLTHYMRQGWRATSPAPRVIKVER